MKTLCALLILVSFCSCAKEPSPSTGTSTAATAAPASAYERNLVATKEKYPFTGWRGGASFVAIFDALIAELVAAGESASETQKLASFRRAVTALNDLHRKDVSLIETSEAEELCGLGNIVAMAAGLDPEKYGHGEGPISAGRDW